MTTRRDHRLARSRRHGARNRPTGRAFAVAGFLGLTGIAGGMAFAWWRSAEPEPRIEIPGASTAFEPTGPDLEPRAGGVDRRAALEAELVAIDRFARENPTRLVEVVTRWEDLRRRAAGTPCEGYAGAMVEQVRGEIEVEAAAEMERTEKRARELAEEMRWDEARAAFEAFPEEYGSTHAAASLENLLETLDRRREEFESGSIYMVADFEPGPDGFRPFAGLDIHVQEIGFPPRGRDVTQLVFFAPGASAASFSFPVASRPEKAYLKVVHVATLIDLAWSYSPVTISLNGTILAGNWSPTNASHAARSEWDVSRYLRAGANELIFRLDGGYSQYWLRHVEVSAVR